MRSVKGSKLDWTDTVLHLNMICALTK